MYSKISKTGFIKKLLGVGVSAIVITSSSTVFAELNSKSTLSITQGVGGFEEPALGTGSWFAMEALGPGGWVYTGIGGVGGTTTSPDILLDGTAQVAEAENLDGDLLNNSAVANIDNPWTFFGSTGQHGSTGITATGVDAIDMAGWYVSWNNVPFIDMGAAGVTTVVCTPAPCADGSAYTLDYATAVPADSPAFPNVAYQLHLEGFITDTNQAPVATDAAASLLASTSVDIDLTGNVTDSDGTVDFTTFSTTYSGTATITNNNGTVTYQDNDGVAVIDSFDYTFQDDNGAVSNTATVDITVAVGNIPPTANSFSVTTNKEQAIIVDVVANTTDTDGTVDATTVETANLVGGTTTVNNVTGDVTFAPAAAFTGIASFDYRVKDDSGDFSNFATVTVNVNAPPVAVDDLATVDRNTAVNIDVTANDTDSDGTVDPATVTITIPATNGVTAIDPVTGVITYTPNTGFLGSDSFDYTINDNLGLTSEAAATVSISVVNALPVAVNDVANIDVSVNADVIIDVTANDTDADGSIDVATVTIISNPSNGTAITDVSGMVTYTPDGTVGSDSFTYTVHDNDGGLSNEAIVIVNVSDAGGAILPPDATLTILPADVGSGTITPADGAGSWFNMEVSPGALTHVSVQGFNQLQLGTTQLGKITEPNIDNPWLFFGNLGIHQTTSDVTVLSDDGQGNVTLDLSGWNVAWNNVASIPLDARANLPGFVDGVGIMTCANDCAVGDSYKLEYSATVPDGDPSGFGNVKYILHLEGVVSQGVPTYGGGDENAAFDVTESIAKDGNGVITVAPGSTAESVGNTTGIGLTPSDIGLKDPLLNDSDGEQCIGGCVDFILTGVTTSFVDLVVKLNDTIPNGAVYRKLMNGVWGDFDESSGDQIASAKSIGGACQGPEGIFEIGLRLGNDCLFMRIFDNGPNDADDTVGTIVDPSGVLLAGSPNRPAGATSGCSISSTPVAFRDRADWILIAIFLSIMGLVKVRRKYNA